MLSNLQGYKDLINLLKEWAKSNSFITESDYEKYSNYCTSDEYDLNTNISIKSDMLLTADSKGYVKEWKLNSYELKRNWGQLHPNTICAMKITFDGKYLLTAGHSISFENNESKRGSLRQWCLKTQQLIKCYGKVQSGVINCLELSNDGKWLVTASSTGRDGGFMKQWIYSPFEEKSFSNFENETENFTFTSNKDKPHYEYFISTHSYGRCHDTCINSIAITPDSNFLFTAGGFYEEYELKMFDLENQIIIRDFSCNYLTG